MTESALILKRLREYSNVLEFPYHTSTHKDRRVATCDRRRCQTYLAKDQRSGVSDRRKRKISVPELVQSLRRKVKNKSSSK
jgi:hypothetical protein